MEEEINHWLGVGKQTQRSTSRLSIEGFQCIRLLDQTGWIICFSYRLPILWIHAEECAPSPRWKRNFTRLLVRMLLPACMTEAWMEESRDTMLPAVLNIDIYRHLYMFMKTTNPNCSQCAGCASAMGVWMGRCLRHERVKSFECSINAVLFPCMRAVWLGVWLKGCKTARLWSLSTWSGLVINTLILFLGYNRSYFYLISLSLSLSHSLGLSPSLSPSLSLSLFLLSLILSFFSSPSFSISVFSSYISRQRVFLLLLPQEVCELGTRGSSLLLLIHFQKVVEVSLLIKAMAQDTGFGYHQTGGEGGETKPWY